MDKKMIRVFAKGQISCRRILASCLASITILGCVYDNQFSDAEAEKPHALVTADPRQYWGDRGPIVFAINSQPTSFWRSKEQYRISTGATTLQVVADREPYDFSPLTFDAMAGRHYHLRYGHSRAFVTLYDITDVNSPVLIQTSAQPDFK
jgi:hypothetical protein